MIIQVFLNSMIFPCMEPFFEIFQVFHEFMSLWEPCGNIHDRVELDDFSGFYLPLRRSPQNFLSQICREHFWGCREIKMSSHQG